MTVTLDVGKDFVPRTHTDSSALKLWGRRVGSPTIPEQGILQAHKALGIDGLQRWSKMGVTGRVGVSSMAVLAPTLSFWPTCSLGPGATGWKGAGRLRFLPGFDLLPNAGREERGGSSLSQSLRNGT